jgi:hypothetical protein
VLTGDSTTGKTRTLYEAMRGVAPSWPVVRPYDDELVRFLEAGQITAGMALWFNETQRFLYSEAGRPVTARCGANRIGTNSPPRATHPTLTGPQEFPRSRPH